MKDILPDALVAIQDQVHYLLMDAVYLFQLEQNSKTKIHYKLNNPLFTNCNVLVLYALGNNKEILCGLPP